MHRLEARSRFFIFDTVVTALVGRRGKACRTGVRSLDRRYRKEAAKKASVPLVLDPSDARLMLRARCGLCPNRCKGPLA